MNYQIEKMNENNALDYAKVSATVWNQSYRGIVSQEFLNDINRAEKIERMTINLKNATEDGSQRFLLKENNEYVGIVRVRETKYTEYRDYGELGALYLLDKAKKKGYGKILFKFAQEQLKKLGYYKMIVGCLEDNPANDFYKHMGGKFIKQYPIKIGNQNMKENIYLYENI